MVLGQRSFDDLGTPLADVTFCVIDLETTGGAAADGGITEVGAVKLHRGERVGTFQTLINPGRSIPPTITMLTGITESMVVLAPRIEGVLPTLLEFIGSSVVVGHNVGYDLRFLRSALARDDRPPLTNRWVDTCSLARRLVRDEVRNCKLATLAEQFRLPNRPSHRALDDALATGDLLHLLLERAAGLGVLGLDDLLGLPTLAGHPQVSKLRLTDKLPRQPGVYLFRDRTGRVLYVGKATNLRTRVRSYFSGDERRKVGQLLREADAIDHLVCSSPLEAAVREVRLIHQLQPRFNRQAKTWSRYAYLKLTAERFPRLSVVKAVKADGATYLGPLPSSRNAKLVAEAIETAVPIRRCTATPTRTLRRAPCAPAQLGVSTCPCAGAITEGDYTALVDRLRLALRHDPWSLLRPLVQRMHDLAGVERFEEAADMRDRAAALAQALRRQRRLDAVVESARLVVEIPGRGGAELQNGLLVRAWGPAGPVDELPFDAVVAGAPAPRPDLRATAGTSEPASVAPGSPLPRHVADEVACVAGWLHQQASNLRLVSCDGTYASALPRLPDLKPGRPPATTTAAATASSATPLAGATATGNRPPTRAEGEQPTRRGPTGQSQSQNPAPNARR